MSEASAIGSADSLSPDQILSNRYRVCRKIGQGGMGEVYLARDDHIQRQVAIKLLRPGATILDAKNAKIFEEALTTAALSHPNIVKVYDVPQLTRDPQIPQRLWGAHYMVMEFIDGETLFLQLRDRRPARTVEEALLLWRDLVGIVRFAHDRGIIHRDLKPGNSAKTPQRWAIDASRLQQMSADLGGACRLPEVLDNAPEPEEILRDAGTSPWRPIPASLWACYQVLCQRLTLLPTANLQANVACEHLEMPNHLSFMTAWGQP